MSETIIVALITGGLALFGTLGGSYLGPVGRLRLHGDLKVGQNFLYLVPEHGGYLVQGLLALDDEGCVNNGHRVRLLSQKNFHGQFPEPTHSGGVAPPPGRGHPQRPRPTVRPKEDPTQ
mgnify:CR=1 FL=1